jgi:hypothetical protein
MSDIELFYQDFMQDLLAQAGAELNFTKSVFTDRMCGHLIEEALIGNHTQVDYKDKTGRAVDAWDYSEEHDLLTLILSDYREDAESLESLTKTGLEADFKRIYKFFDACTKGKFHKALDESMPATELAWFIHDNKKDIKKTTFILVSNAQLSDRIKSLPKISLKGIEVRTEVWDIGRLHRTEESGKGKEDIEIDLKEYSRDKKGLRCLPASGGADGVESYLLAIPGDILADLYDEYGERLLEQNVRTFLQFRGKVNKGIRNTIINEPSMFFPYNNGISATAESIVTGGGSSRIVSIKNLQIVNGGQTTAAIFNAAKGKDKAPLKDVFVQMKLSLVPAEDVEVVVPKISEYANTQNKVNAADFFSNHPFHLRIEDISRRLWANPIEGGTLNTHWFYERARGQFANQQALLTPAKKKKFLSQNPRHQMFTKTDLAKYSLSFEEKPHTVSLGAQKAFSGSAKAGGFIQHIIKQWDDSKGNDFNDLWFKRAIAKALLFRVLDKLIFKQDWYQGYKAQTVTYTLAKFSSMLRKQGNNLDFIKIWENQKIEPALEDGLVEIAEQVADLLTSPPEYATNNIGEWAKREDCWKIIEKEDMPFPEDIEDCLISHSEETERNKDAGRDRKHVSSVEQQAYVFEKGAEHWRALSEWNEVNKKLTAKELGILRIACQVPNRFPSDKQAPLLVKAEERAIEEGFFTG